MLRRLRRSTPRAVIVGTGRSGSGYIARVLTNAGIPCGHEGWWNPIGERQRGLLVDSSWCALALGLDDYRGHVFHQVRHPLDFVSSMVKRPAHGPWRELANTLLPAVPADPVEYAMLWWLTFVDAAERRSEATWRLEDVNGDLLVASASAVGVELNDRLARSVVAAEPQDVNFHGEGRRLTLADLPAGELRDRLVERAGSWWPDCQGTP